MRRLIVFAVLVFALLLSSLTVNAQAIPGVYLPLLRGQDAPPEPSPTATPSATPTEQATQPVPTAISVPDPTSTPTEEPRNCHRSYPTLCIPPPPPDLNCPDIPYRRFPVLPPDPHNFDGDHDGIGCET